MTTSTLESSLAIAQLATVSDDTLSVDLSDGRTIAVPLAWFPRLVHASLAERKNWRLIGGGRGIHWTDIDEDISVENLLAGNRSGESQVSYQNWLRARASTTASKQP